MIVLSFSENSVYKSLLDKQITKIVFTNRYWTSR